MARRGDRSAPRVSVTCSCGKAFEVLKSRYDAGRGRRCSVACQNKYATRPSGLTYVKHKENLTSFKPGEHRSPGTEFKRGQEAWNKGVPSGRVPLNVFKPSAMLTYGALHCEVRQARGPASRQSCTRADATCKGPIQWANISGLYEGIWDFDPMCQSHHVRYDQALGRWGGSTEWRRSR